MPKPKEESTVRFIECVRVNDLLWDRSHPDHKDFNKRSVAWETIASFCGFENGEMAKKKWKHLTTARSGSQKLIEGQGTCEYLYAIEMNFLDGIIKRKRRRPSETYSSNFNNVEILNNEDEPVDPNISSTSSQQPKNKISLGLNLDEGEADSNEQILSAIEAVIGQQKNLSVDEETEGSLFGKIIGRRLDGMDRKKRAKAQIEIQTLLFKYEFEE